MRYILVLLLAGMLAACSTAPSPQSSDGAPASGAADPSESRSPLPTLPPLASLDPDATPDVTTNGLTFARAAFEEAGLTFTETASQFGAPSNQDLIRGRNADESVIVTLLRWPDTEERLQSRSLSLAASVAADERDELRALFAENLASLTTDEVGEFFLSAEADEEGVGENITDGGNEYFLSVIETEDGALELVFTDLSVIEPAASEAP